MRCTPETARILEQIAGLPPLETLTVEEGRRQAVQRASPRPEPPIARIEDGGFAGPAGQVPLRFYYPLNAAGSLPILLFFHGSGFVVANLDTHDRLCSHLCATTGALVISVDYRLAPEHPFPAAPDDCLAAALWTREQAHLRGGDPGRIIVCGDSAGGNLAAVTALAMRDRGEALAGQLLFYPVTDAPDPERSSYRDNGSGCGLTASGMAWYWRHYVGDRPFDWRAAPLRAPSLEGTPPAYIVTAGLDVLRDEGREYAERLAAAGVPVEHVDVPGVMHAFAGMIGIVPEAGRIIAEAARWCRARFGQG